jgi:hypothetical protein
MADALPSGEAVNAARDALVGYIDAESHEPELIVGVQYDAAKQASQTKRFHGLTKTMLDLSRGREMKATRLAPEEFDARDLAPDAGSAATIAAFLAATRTKGSEVEQYFQEISAEAHKPEKNQLLQGLHQMAQVERDEARPPTFAERVDHAITQGPTVAFREIALGRAEELQTLPAKTIDTVMRQAAAIDAGGVLTIVVTILGPKLGGIPAKIWTLLAEALGKDLTEQTHWRSLLQLPGAALAPLCEALWTQQKAMPDQIRLIKMLILVDPSNRLADVLIDQIAKSKSAGSVQYVLAEARYTGQHPLAKPQQAAPKPAPPKPSSSQPPPQPSQQPSPSSAPASAAAAEEPPIGGLFD